MKWFIPSWNGDVRVEKYEHDPENKTMITVVTPTAAELVALQQLEPIFQKNGWIHAKDPLAVPPDYPRLWDPSKPYRKNTHGTVLHAKVSEVAPVVIAHLKSGEATLSAVVLKDGKVETVSGTDMADLDKLAAVAQEKGKAAATVKRPTPCCPQCHDGAVLPATEALLSFLDDKQHETWARDRYIVVYGQLTGNAYMLTHRHTDRAKRFGRICYDLTDNFVVHFHDMSVPPEEEVLAAKLILEHREPWLRNEATSFGAMFRFKNPFGDGGDGTADSSFTHAIGMYAMEMAR